MEKLQKDREYLVTENLNLIHYILRKTFHMSLGYTEYEDYFQEGCIGMILAAIRFDETKGFKFSTYATQMIIGSIQRYRRDKQNMIRVPRDKYTLLMRVIQLSTQGYSLENIIEITGYSGEDIQKCLQLGCLDSLDRSVLTDDSSKDISMYEQVRSPGNPYEEALSEEHIFKSIPKVTELLGKEKYQDIWEEYIWSLYYGERLSQEYLAMKYGCSQAQISRILRTCKKLFVKVLAS